MVVFNTFLGCVCLSSAFVRAFSHAYLADPPSRNLIMHWEGLENCPHCLNANGPLNVIRRGLGVWPTARDPTSHGLCGDPVQNRNDAPTLADEPYMIPMAPQQVYRAGSVVEFSVGVSTHHNGHYEFRICNQALDGRTLASAAEGQTCLDAWQLLRAPPPASCSPGDLQGDCQPIDANNPGRWYLPPPREGTQQAGMLWTSERANDLPAVSEVHTMRFIIPEELVCEHCTLQWYYATANTCLPDSSYIDYFRNLHKAGWPAAKWSPLAVATWAKCSNACCGRQGIGKFGEEFWNCADIRIVPPSNNANFALSTSPPLKTHFCTWHASAWSPCSTSTCGSYGTRTRLVTCHCNSTPSLSTSCESVRPSWKTSCQGACKQRSTCKTEAWHECAGSQLVTGLEATDSPCCKAPLTCKSYGKVWAQCEPSVISETLDQVSLTITVRLAIKFPAGLNLCHELADLVAQTAMWAGVDEVGALSRSCEATDPPTRRLFLNGDDATHDREKVRHVHMKHFERWVQKNTSVVQVPLATPNSSARGLNACPSNDMNCDCTWASVNTCRIDDGSLCWCPCCCPLGGVCKMDAISGNAIKTTIGADNEASCGIRGNVTNDAETFDNRDFAFRHGKLKLSGVQLVDASGEALQLMGISSHGLQWFPSCYTKESLLHLVQHWGINLFRVALYIGESGYASKPSLMQSVKDIVNWCEELGIYVIIDWHVLTPGDPNYWLTGAGKQQVDASKFWHDIATTYKGKSHVLYEICNEPNGVSWSSVKSYADSIIATIRKVDAETIILVGTPTWSQDIHLAAATPVAQPHNVMYAFHFYSGTHRALLSRVRTYALRIPIFVTEWGTSRASGDGGPFLETARDFLDLFGAIEETGVLISWAQWSFADKAETSASLKPGSCSRAAWNDVSCSGAFVREYIQSAGRRSQSITNVTRAKPSAPKSATLAGTLQFLIPSSSQLASESYGTIGVTNGIANISKVASAAVHVVLASTRRLASTRTSRRTGAESIVHAKYTIQAGAEAAAMEIATRLTQESASQWSVVIQSEIAKAAIFVGINFEAAIEVISMSIPVLHNAAEWHVGAWGTCSKSCGHGVKVRPVTCSVGPHQSSEGCDLASRPREAKECALVACPASFSGKTYVPEIMVRFRPKSNAHRSALSARLADAAQVKRLDEWLFLWLANKSGAFELSGEGFGKVIKWCEGCSLHISADASPGKEEQSKSFLVLFVVFVPLCVVFSLAAALRQYRTRESCYCIRFLMPTTLEGAIVAHQQSPRVEAWGEKAGQKYHPHMPAISVAAHAAMDFKPPCIACRNAKQDEPALAKAVLAVLPICCKSKLHKPDHVVAVTDPEDVAPDEQR